MDGEALSVLLLGPPHFPQLFIASLAQRGSAICEPRLCGDRYDFESQAALLRWLISALATWCGQKGEGGTKTKCESSNRIDRNHFFAAPPG
jgi:hypothetical protein